ncbi:hypothetical protein AAEO56_12640 [Flavobacterium sp. DGU11]|uniref:Uncharacterized protein n=1 Tax=Flavobacterium arundinis TaxID=3139143 RepID=A0ABU9HY79_9FLAO
MKHTKEQIIEKAKIIVKDLRGKYYSENCIDDAFFREKEYVDFGKHNGKTMQCWVVSVLFFEGRFNFLTISDVSGEPLYYQNINTIMFEIEKTKDGTYYKVDPE